MQTTLKRNMARNLIRTNRQKIEETGNNIAKLLKVITQPASQRILITIRDAYAPLTWKQISKIAQVGYYSHGVLSELYNYNLVKPIVSLEERACGWVLATDLVEKITLLLELHLEVPHSPDKRVLKLEKKFNEFRYSVKKKDIDDALIKKAQTLKDLGKTEAYNALMEAIVDELI